MRILFLTQVLPYPLDAGPKVRIYYILRYLAQRHQVTLLSFVRGETEKSFAEHLDSFCRAVHTVPLRRSRGLDAFHFARSLFTRQPFLIARDEVVEMHRQVQQLVSNDRFDVIHADQLAMAQYAIGQRQMKRVLDEHNAVWTIVHRHWQNQARGARKFVLGLERKKLQRYEGDVCKKFDRVITVTQEDKRALEAVMEPSTGQKRFALTSNSDLQLTAPDLRTPITVIPICIDTEEIPKIERSLSAKNVVCVGGMFYPPNVDGVIWFGREVLPLLKAAEPGTRFVVVGARPDPAIVQLAQEDASIQVTGYVHDTTLYLRESAVFVVPLRAGGGMRVKILDAWARGIPIVSTTIGCEGIEKKEEENILVADSPRAFAQAVLRVLRDPDLGERLSANGREWVARHYNWRVVYRKLDEIYDG